MSGSERRFYKCQDPRDDFTNVRIQETILKNVRIQETILKNVRIRETILQMPGSKEMILSYVLIKRRLWSASKKFRERIMVHTFVLNFLGSAMRGGITFGPAGPKKEEKSGSGQGRASGRSSGQTCGGVSLFLNRPCAKPGWGLIRGVGSARYSGETGWGAEAIS